MNTKQLQYVLSLSQLRSFSKVAEMYNITQPALSKTILNLENELNIRLFDRSCIPLELTPAGEFFVQEAKQLVYREDQLLKSLDKYRTGEKGKLTIGISPFRNLYWMPDIVQKIKTRYPEVQIVLHEDNSDCLRREAAEGRYDFAVVNLPVDESVLDIIPLEPEILVLAVPHALAAELPSLPGKRLQEVDFADCRNLPFVVVAHQQEMRVYFDKLCAEEDFIPNIAVEISGGISSAWAMAQAGIGATLLPFQFVGTQKLSDKLTLFELKNKEYLRHPVIVTRHGQYISEYARYAMELCRVSNMKAL